MIDRQRHLSRLEWLLRSFPVVALLGARQVGKTTLARTLASRWSGDVHHFDLENPDDLARLAEPMLALGDLRGLVVLDEVQRAALPRSCGGRRPRASPAAGDHRPETPEGLAGDQHTELR